MTSGVFSGLYRWQSGPCTVMVVAQVTLPNRRKVALCCGDGRTTSGIGMGVLLLVCNGANFFFCATVGETGPEEAHRALCPRCAKSRLFSTTGSHGSQSPKFCTPDAVLNGSCTSLAPNPPSLCASLAPTPILLVRHGHGDDREQSIRCFMAHTPR